jgi:hypothetical protein
MTKASRAGLNGTAGILLAASVAACAGSSTTASTSTSTSATAEPTTSSVVAGQASAPGPTPTTGLITARPTVPAEPAAIPEGVYRTHITRDDLIAQNADDLSDAGTWTLTITKGEYKLECRPVADPGLDCGNSLPTQTLMEIGGLRGTGDRAWFVMDMARKATLIGCARHSEAANGCGPESPYGFTWRLTAKGLTFSDFVGVGESAGQAIHYANNTLKPWAKIG